MNKFKKITVGLIVAAGVSCLGGAVACTEDKPDYYKLTFEGSGFDYVLQDALASFESGGKVKEGLEVKFTLSLGATTIGSPVIYLNDEEIQPENGVYSFVMDGDKVVKAEGLTNLFTVTLDRYERVLGADGYVREERRLHYTDEDGNVLDDEVRVPEGGTLKFKLDVSSYYKQSGYNVSRNTEIVEPDENGVYTLENVTSNATVTVENLVQEESFATAKEGHFGTGTAEDPFQISKPIDLYYMAVLVNSEFYSTTYNFRHFKLMNDIDMGGEQLFVIGDTSIDTAVFCGTFDGDGHTISNFYITDEVVDQETYENEYLPFVGLFGEVVPTLNAPAVIKNVNLADYEVRIHTASAGSSTFAGSLVGYGIGVQISNCHSVRKDENAKMQNSFIALGDDDKMIYMGGLAGLLQAAYNQSGRNIITYDSFVSSCSTDIAMHGLGSPRSVGGVVGYLVSSDESAIAYAVNCYSKGDISGGMHCGGIVGTLGRYSTVINCYSTSAVNANNGVDSVLLNADYRGAYAGGIVGYAEEDTVVSGCYSANQTLSAASAAFPKYAKTGEFVGDFRAAGYVSKETSAVVLYNNSTETYENLGWNEDDWDFEGDLPGLKGGSAQRTVALTVKNGANEIISTSKTGEGYAPLHAWYSDNQTELDEYVTSGGSRGWGLYFDEQLTVKAPYGYVPVGDVTLYTGLADYGEVAGRYYIQTVGSSDSAYFDLTENGEVLFRNGGMSFEGRYIYDGDKTIVLYDTCFALLSYTLEQTNGNTVTMVGEKKGNGFVLTGLVEVVDSANSTAEQQQTTTESMTLTASKALVNFKYGDYYAADGLYRFGEDGTGVYTGWNERLTFSYKEVDGEIEIALTSGGYWSATLENGAIKTVNGTTVRAKNAFNGAWVMAANSTKIFTFDGIDSVMYADGDNVNQPVTYTVSGVQATFTVGGTAYTAKFEDGVLKINGQTCNVYNGFLGGWYMSVAGERIDVDLEGYGTSGYGYAAISYFGDEVATYNAQYDVAVENGVSVIRLYVNDALYGELTYAAATKSASGLFYSLNNDAYYQSARFYQYDNFKGTWVSSSDIFDTVTFNGKTADGTGEARLIYKGNTSEKGTYTLINAVSGTLTVDSVVYEVSIDLDEGTVNFKVESDDFDDNLARRDDWYGVVLYEGEVSYTFDGKGNTGKGKVSLSDGTELEYKFVNGNLVIDNKTVTASGSGFSWNNKTLVFKTGFSGKWLVSGTQKYLTVGEVQSDFTAAVTFEGVSGTYMFAYDPSDNTLKLTETVGNERIVTNLLLSGSNEMSLERESVSESNSYNCIAESGVDVYIGTYAAADGSSWTFDGLGNCRYGTGTAVFRTSDGVETIYSYNINKIGAVYIRANGGIIFISAEDGAYVKGGESEGYTTVTPDAFRDKLAVAAENGKNVNYLFDGIGGLWREGENGYEKLYSYEIVASNKCTVTDGEGNEYACKLTAQGRTTFIDIVEFDGVRGEYAEKSAEGASWTFDGYGKCVYGTGTATYTVVDGDKTTKTSYNYSVNEEGEVIIVKDNKNYKAAFTVEGGETVVALQQVEA